MRRHPPPGTGETRQLLVQGDDFSLEVEVLRLSNGLRRLFGQLAPPQPATIEVVCPGGVRSSRADELGRFFADDLSPGLVRVALRPGGSARGLVTCLLDI